MEHPRFQINQAKVTLRLSACREDTKSSFYTLTNVLTPV